MKQHEKEHIDRAMKSLDRVILAVRATGGHKYRAQIKATDQEIEGLVAAAEARFRGLAVSNIIALSMLTEPDFFGRNRLVEFQDRLQEALTSAAAEPFDDVEERVRESKAVRATCANLRSVIGLLSAMVDGGEVHTPRTLQMVVVALECIESLAAGFPLPDRGETTGVGAAQVAV